MSQKLILVKKNQKLYKEAKVVQEWCKARQRRHPCFCSVWEQTDETPPPPPPLQYFPRYCPRPCQLQPRPLPPLAYIYFLFSFVFVSSHYHGFTQKNVIHHYISSHPLGYTSSHPPLHIQSSTITHISYFPLYPVTTNHPKQTPTPFHTFTNKSSTFTNKSSTIKYPVIHHYIYFLFSFIYVSSNS